MNESYTYMDVLLSTNMDLSYAYKDVCYTNMDGCIIIHKWMYYLVPQPQHQQPLHLKERPYTYMDVSYKNMDVLLYTHMDASYTYVDVLYSLWIYPSIIYICGCVVFIMDISSHTYMDVLCTNMDVLLYTRMDVSYSYVDVEYSLWMFHTHMDA